MNRDGFHSKNKIVRAERVLDSWSGACLLCPARAWRKDLGQYVCDPTRFTEGIRSVMRLRPSNCPDQGESDEVKDSAYTILAKILRR